MKKNLRDENTHLDIVADVDVKMHHMFVIHIIGTCMMNLIMNGYVTIVIQI